MRNLLTIAFLTLLVCSCATTKPRTTIVSTQDSIRTEIKYKLIESIDTVFITLPPQTVERTSPDTTSTLENDYAKTTATILPNGMLFHNLETKQTPVPIPTKKTEAQRDSVVYREKEVPVPYPVEVEVNRLSWMQQAQIYGFRVLVAILLLGAAVRYRKKIFQFVRRFI